MEEKTIINNATSLRDSRYGKLVQLNEAADYWISATKEEIQANREKNNGDLVVVTCAQRSDRINAMKRKYPHGVLQREYDYFSEKIEKRAAYGEQDHPDRASVEWAHSCVGFTNQEWRKGDDGSNEWWLEMRFLPNTLGDDMRKIFEDGWRVSISSRGLGSVKHDGEADVVQEDFVIITFDLVTEPSTFNSNLIVKEGVDVRRYLNEADADVRRRYLEARIAMVKQANAVQDRVMRKFYEV